MPGTDDRVALLSQLVDAILQDDPAMVSRFGQADQDAAAQLRAEIEHTDEPAA